MTIATQITVGTKVHFRGSPSTPWSKGVWTVVSIYESQGQSFIQLACPFAGMSIPASDAPTQLRLA